MKLCAVDDCGKAARGTLCPKHAVRLRKHGDVNTVLTHRPRRRRSAADRFFAKVAWSDQRHSGTRCLEWTAALNHGRYGLFSPITHGPGKGNKLAHRWLWEHWIGPIPEGLQIDHLCRNPSCVNPAHLEPVTAAENLRRGAPYRVSRKSAFCMRGHPFNEKHRCDVCRRAAANARNARKRAAKKAAQDQAHDLYGDLAHCFMEQAVA